MNLLITGVNHHTAPVEIRERLAFDEQRLSDTIQQLRSECHFPEAMILSTCNRVEIAVSSDEPTGARELIESFITRTRAVDPEAIRRYLFNLEGKDAVRHLFRVAASLDSMVVGEPQILGQLKAAYTVAKAQGALNGFLDLVLTRAFSVAKRVRTETEIGSSAVSVSYAAVELAREIFGSLGACRMLLVGAGKMSELAARHLKRAGVERISVTNRTRERAAQVAELVGGVVVEYGNLENALPDHDIVITSSAAPHYVITRETMKRVIETRRNKPLFLIDIAVPRNVEPAVNQVDGVFVYDMDDLQAVVDRNLRGRQDEALEADRIVTEEVDRLENWLRAREAAPLIISLQEQLEKVRLAEIERVRGKLSGLTRQQEEAVEALTRGLINKIAHMPISELRKNANTAESVAFAEAVRKIFRLDSF